MATPGQYLAVLKAQAVKEGMGKIELAQYIANLAHESGNFKRMTENLNYRAERLLELFGPRKTSSGKDIPARNGYKTLQDWKGVVSGGTNAIAEAIYGGAWGARNLGNIYPGDGAKYPGRGFIQLTGRDNYTKIGMAIGVDLATNPELAAEPEVAAKIAIYFWKNRGASEKAKAKDFRGARRAVNGGTLGYEEVQKIAALIEADKFVV